MSRKNPPSNTSSYQPISYLDDGAPYSRQFDDIYFDSKQGIAQSQTIFIAGNQLPQRWSELPKNTAHEFIIAETGFGTGLNFLLTLQAYERWLKTKPVNKQTLKIRFISTEKFPLSREELAQSLSAVPSVQPYADMLLSSYPHQFGQYHQCQFFDQCVTLELHINDATKAFASLAQSSKPAVNAWFLDGFSPAKNPDMWQNALYHAMADISAPDASVATFTVAGHVRRGLEKNGFRLQKTSSQLNKSHYLTGRFQPLGGKVKGYWSRPKIPKPQQVTIIGGGIASACTALTLARRGIRVQLICKDDSLSQGASSNAIGALYPLIHQTPDILSQFFSQAFVFAKQYYQQLAKQGYSFDHNWCGLIEVAHSEAKRQRMQKFAAINSWPHDLVHCINEQQVDDIAGVHVGLPGLYFPASGWVSPKSLIHALTDAAMATGNCKIKLNTHVSKISRQQDDQWLIHTPKGQINSKILIVCAGNHTHRIEGLPDMHTYPVQGQVSYLQTNNKAKLLATVLCHKGYLTPENNGIHCIGATFNKQVNSHEARAIDNQKNLTSLEQGLPHVNFWTADDIVADNMRVRACTDDHLPIAGPVPDEAAHRKLYAKLGQDKNWPCPTPAPYINNLYTLTGLGARGLCSAPLLAEILAADLCGTPYPISEQLLFNLSANRFVMKNIIRNKPG